MMCSLSTMRFGANGENHRSPFDSAQGRLSTTPLWSSGVPALLAADESAHGGLGSACEGTDIEYAGAHARYFAAGGDWEGVRRRLGKPGDRVVVLVGHDINLANMAGMLNLNWIIFPQLLKRVRETGDALWS